MCLLLLEGRAHAVRAWSSWHALCALHAQHALLIGQHCCLCLTVAAQGVSEVLLVLCLLSDRALADDRVGCGPLGCLAHLEGVQQLLAVGIMQSCYAVYFACLYGALKLGFAQHEKAMPDSQLLLNLQHKNREISMIGSR